MTSNDDLMEFMKNMEKKRSQENEELAEIRRRERLEDREEIAKLIDKKIDEKVEKAIAPFKDKNDKVEQVQLEMKEQVSHLLEQMELVQEKLKNSESVGSNPTWAEAVVLGQNRAKQKDTSSMTPGNLSEELRSITSLSRRTVGLQKIDQDDLIRMRQEQFGGAKSEEEEQMLAVQEFLLYELKLPKTTTSRMQIERIFPPVGKENPQWLYVTFKEEASVKKIFEKTRIMRKDSRILTYIPKEFHSRFQAIRDIGNTLRFEQQCKTRIKMGSTDLQLHKKDRESGRWQLVQLPADLPSIEFGCSPVKPDSGSPAPGRPGQGRVDKRGRESTDSSPNNTPKVARIDDKKNIGDKNEEFRKAVEEAELVGESTISPVKAGVGLQKQLDRGMIVSVTATPSKSSNLTPYEASPILKPTRNNTNQQN